MKNKIFVILFTSCLMISILGCKNNHKGLKSFSHFIKDVTFPNVKGVVFNQGVITDKSMGEEYFWFADLTSGKWVKFFDLNGKLKDSTSITKAEKYFGYEIDEISVLSFDTIALSRHHSDEIVFINHLGECWKILDIDSAMGIPFKDQKYNYSFTYSVSNQSIFLNDNSLILHLSPMYPSESKDPYTNAVNYVNALHNCPYFLKLTDLFGKVKFQFGFSNYWKSITKPLYICSYITDYSILNGKIFVINPFIDYIFQINPQSLKIEKKIKIQSKHTQIGFPPIKLTRNNASTLYKIKNLCKDTCGSIQRILYSKSNEKYIVIVQNKWTRKDFTSLVEMPPKYTVIIFDKKFKKLGEYEFNRKKSTYLFPGFMAKDGFFAYKLKTGKKNPLRISNNEVYGLFHFKN